MDSSARQWRRSSTRHGSSERPGLSEGLREQLNNRGLTKVRCLRLQDELLQSAQVAHDADPDPRDEIQRRVIDASLKGLENVRGRTHKGWRATDARGRIVMPCGTGKTRVGYRIARALTTSRKTPDGTDRLTIVLCPSIGLVRQLKTAYEVMAKSDGVAIETLAVCSDRSGDSAKRRKPNVDEALADDPTTDLSGIDGSEITGAVRRKAQDIADWIAERGRDPVGWPVIVSTYQSGPTLAEGVRHAGADAAVLICDEAHRTAGLKKTPKANEATLRNFTVCHDNALLPARNRVYMTATPKTFTRGTAEAHDEGYVVVSMNDEATFGPNLSEVSYREAVEQEALTDYRIAAIVPITRATGSLTSARGNTPGTRRRRTPKAHRRGRAETGRRRFWCAKSRTAQPSPQASTKATGERSCPCRRASRSATGRRRRGRWRRNSTTRRCGSTSPA